MSALCPLSGAKQTRYAQSEIFRVGEEVRPLEKATQTEKRVGADGARWRSFS
jgi:hypothetical protein